MLFIIFFLLGGKKTPPITNETIKEMMNNVSIYLSVKTITSLATGLIIAIILLAFKVKLALLFALFAFLLNFIPSVGSIIAVLLPVPVLFLQFGLGGHLCLIVGLLTATEFIIGNLIEPRFLGDGMDLHPAVVIASLIFWGLVWGVPGAFLSVPITASDASREISYIVMDDFEMSPQEWESFLTRATASNLFNKVREEMQ